MCERTKELSDYYIKMVLLGSNNLNTVITEHNGNELFRIGVVKHREIKKLLDSQREANKEEVKKNYKGYIHNYQ